MLLSNKPSDRWRKRLENLQKSQRKAVTFGGLDDSEFADDGEGHRFLRNLPMKIKPLVPDNFIKPEYKRELSGGMDIYLQQDVTLNVGADNVINLGFAAEVPEGHIAMLPRSSTGMKGIAY